MTKNKTKIWHFKKEQISGIGNAKVTINDNLTNAIYN